MPSKLEIALLAVGVGVLSAGCYLATRKWFVRRRRAIIAVPIVDLVEQDPIPTVIDEACAKEVATAMVESIPESADVATKKHINPSKQKMNDRRKEKRLAERLARWAEQEEARARLPDVTVAIIQFLNPASVNLSLESKQAAMLARMMESQAEFIANVKTEADILV